MNSARLTSHPSLQEAEGYLDLLLATQAHQRLPRDVRVPLAERAVAALDRCAERYGWNARLLFMRGQALRLMDRYSEAVVPLRRAAELMPRSRHIRLLLAWCYKRCQRIDLAIETLEDALVAAPQVAILHYNLACYWSLARNPRLAMHHLAKAIEIEPDYRDRVATEADFDPVRWHPRFKSLVSVIV
jgi:tetratricopeptide (TPR) repeat protein